MKIAIITPELDVLASNQKNIKSTASPEPSVIAKQSLALAEALHKHQYEVALFLPRYAWLPKKAPQIITSHGRIRMRLAPSKKEFNVYTHQPIQSVPVYLIGKDTYFKRPYIYGEDGLYDDHVERFEYFGLSAVESWRVIDFRPDCVITLGSMLASVPLSLNRDLKEQVFYQSVKTVFVDYTKGIPAEFEPDSLTHTYLYTTLENKQAPVNLSKVGFLNANKTFISDAQTAGELPVDDIIASLNSVETTQPVQQLA